MEDTNLPSKKRPTESSGAGAGSSKKRALNSGGSDHHGVSVSDHKVKILFPSGVTVPVKISKRTEWISVRNLAAEAEKELERAVRLKKVCSPKRGIRWGANLRFLDDSDNVFEIVVSLSNLESNKVYNLRLDDGSPPAELYENMWDLTPDTDLLMELPEEYSFETAMADLIDNSLQAVWSNDAKEPRLIRVDVSDKKLSVFDTGPGMDSSSIEKWGKMGASLHRVSKAHAIGIKPPYLKPAFGMFGYGGVVASMHLGRHTEVSSKTKSCKKVYMLRHERDALVNRCGSGSKRTWRTYGSLREPMVDELGSQSFTKVEIFEPRVRNVDIRRFQCRLKDIYFSYIQCDEISKTGGTTMPVIFQVNGENLAGIRGGEVAITNLNSCNGPEFVLELRFQLNHANAAPASSPGARVSREANARIRCVYLPVKEGNESIENILEDLKADGFEYTERFENCSHVSCRRLGRLLPDARWAWLPFMDFRRRKVERAQVLKKCCMRVKCFIETDAGFSPTPSKTDFAHQNPYTTALRNLGNKQPLETETDSSAGVHIDIIRDGKPLTLSQLDKQYQLWLLQMNENYDEEADCGTDDPVFVVNPNNKKELHISKNVVRVHKALRRKGKSWKSGQKVKVLKGACAGCHQKNVYATLEYFLLEGLQGDAGGETWIICRPLGMQEDDGCHLKDIDGNPVLDLRKSISIPISVIDSAKCLVVDDSEWHNQVEKQLQKSPSSIEILGVQECRELGIKVMLPDEAEVYAGHIPPSEIVAVVRRASFKSGTPSKLVVKDDLEMTLKITLASHGDGRDEMNLYSGRVTPSSRIGFHGLYVFQPKTESHPLFQRAGIYAFSFSIRDSSRLKHMVKVRVKALPEVQKWALVENTLDDGIKVGRCFPAFSIASFDRYRNQIPFTKVPKLEFKVNCNKGTSIKVRKWNTSTSSDKLSLIVKNLLIESSNLDNIRPSYDATLTLCLPHGLQLLDVPLKVFPGSVERVLLQPENFEKQLVPGHVIKKLILELFDKYGNHVQENEEIQLSVDGFDFLDKAASIAKVDDCGYIHLGGLLKVVARYGRNVCLSVLSGGKVITRKEWQIERRQLKIVSVIPESCVAGSQLENVEFEIIDSKGDVDPSFHDDDKNGESHTLVLKSQFMGINESVKYSFHDGRCLIRAVPVPFEEGYFSFVAAHSRHMELQLTVKVHVELPREMDHDVEPLSTEENISRPPDSYATIGPQMEHYCVKGHFPDENTPFTPDSSSAASLKSVMESCANFQKGLEKEIQDYGLMIKEHQDRLQKLENYKRLTELHLSVSQASRDQILSFGTCGSTGKDVVRARVESQTNSAAAVVTKLLREASKHGNHDFEGRIIGVVALLGTAPTLELSRILAEYLGDQMLAVVCKSYEDTRLLETYTRDGKLSRTHVLHKFAAALGQSINGRYHVLCIDDIRAFENGSDRQGMLSLPEPILPNGDIPAGFLGYAVNMINIDADHLDIRSLSGHGLRETLFYRLFGETQVYETREDMKRAVPCIKDGAVSLDGGILRGNGAMSLGCWDSDITFPIVSAENEAQLQENKHVIMVYNEKKLKLKQVIVELEKEQKSYEKTTRRFLKRKATYEKYFKQKDPSSFCLVENLKSTSRVNGS